MLSESVNVNNNNIPKILKSKNAESIYLDNCVAFEVLEFEFFKDTTSNYNPCKNNGCLKIKISIVNMIDLHDYSLLLSLNLNVFCNYIKNSVSQFLINAILKKSNLRWFLNKLINDDLKRELDSFNLECIAD